MGRVTYQEGLKTQELALREALEQPHQLTLLGFEFDAVITLGKRGKPEEDLIESSQIEVIEVDRGGQATLHSPGQLVIYPVCNIKFLDQTLKEWVSFLLHTTSKTIIYFQLPNFNQLRAESTGLYLGEKKVVSIGLRVVRGVSTHGLAINLRNDISLFNSIRPCGSVENNMGSLKFNGELEDFFKIWAQFFEEGLKIDKTVQITQA